MTHWIHGRVVDNTHWTDNLFSLQVEAPVEPFRAGQYINLGLELDGRLVTDPYSIISGPGEQPLEFFLYTHLEGELSTALARLRAGDTLTIESQASGDFTLDQVPSADTLWLLATGTGVAPFIAMLRSERPWQQFRHVVLAYAARVRDDLCYTRVIDSVRDRHPRHFSFVPFISREAVRDTVHGHIPEAITDGALEAAAERSLDPASSQVMLCGNPGMIKEAVARLETRGFTRNRPASPGELTFEAYW